MVTGAVVMGSVVIFFGSVVGSVVSFSVVGFVFSVVSVVGSVVFWSAAQCSAVHKTIHYVNVSVLIKF